MRRFTKGMLIASGVFGAAGIGLIAVGVAMGASISDIAASESMREKIRWIGESMADDYYDSREIQDMIEDTELTGLTTVRKTESDEADVYDLQYQPLNFEFEMRYDELILEEGDKYQVYVYEDDGNDVTVKEDQETLKIISKRKKSDAKSDGNRKICVFYPKNVTLQELDIELGAGRITFNRDVETETVELELGAGEFSNSGTVTAREADLEVGTGSMELHDLSAREINGECGVGSMDLTVSGEPLDYNYSLECGIGKISIASESYSGLGKEKYISNNAHKNIDLECGIGNISVGFITEDV